MNFEIIDFHTHPFKEEKNNICFHKDSLKMGVENTEKVLRELGITKICGSVIDSDNKRYSSCIEKIKSNNRKALELRERYKDFYIPGFHVHPDFVEESVNEIHFMKKEGVKLIGELVPYLDGWNNYASCGLSSILEEAGKCNMVVSFHTIDEPSENIDKMVKSHKDVIFVAAHPGEYNVLMNHIERAKKYENYYLDLSGTGMFRYGMLRRAIDAFGADRILFGSDYPVCNPAMYVGGVLFDSLITDSEREKIFALNAKRLLEI